uniref:Cylicin-2 n=1 Tax=Solanum tuberosum TaxID=4113 RepID=M1DGK2_SOLTU
MRGMKFQLLGNLPQDQITALEEDHNKGEELDLVRITSILNQENNQDKEHTPTHRIKPLQHDHADLSTKETTDGNMQGKMQGNQNVVVKQTQAAQHTNAKEQIEASKEKQYGNGEKDTWKVRDKTNPNENTMQQNKEYGKKQPNSTNKEKTGKSGHILGECPTKEKDEEIKKRKEVEAIKKGQEKQLNQTSKGNQQHEEGKAKTHSNKKLMQEDQLKKILHTRRNNGKFRKKNKNQQQHQDQGKNHNPQVQV